MTIILKNLRVFPELTTCSPTFSALNALVREQSFYDDWHNFKNPYEKYAELAKKDSAPKWSNNATYRQLIFDNNNFISPFCKNLLEVVAEVDSNFKINPANFNSDDFVGKRCPFLFVAEEYSYNGEVKTRVAVDKPIHFADFKAGNVVIPQTKKIDNFSYSTPPTNNSNDPLQGTPVANEDLPF